MPGKWHTEWQSYFVNKEQTISNEFRGNNSSFGAPNCGQPSMPQCENFRVLDSEGWIQIFDIQDVHWHPMTCHDNVFASCGKLRPSAFLPEEIPSPSVFQEHHSNFRTRAFSPFQVSLLLFLEIEPYRVLFGDFCNLPPRTVHHSRTISMLGMLEYPVLGKVRFRRHSPPK